MTWYGKKVIFRTTTLIQGALHHQSDFILMGTAAGSCCWIVFLPGLKLQVVRNGSCQAFIKNLSLL